MGRRRPAGETLAPPLGPGGSAARSDCAEVAAGSRRRGKLREDVSPPLGDALVGRGTLRKGSAPPRGDGEGAKALAAAAEEWGRWGAERQESFFGTVEGAFAKALKRLGKAKDLAEISEVHAKVRVAILALLHHHLHHAGAKHTSLRRALELSEKTARFQERVADACGDHRPALKAQAEAMAEEACRWAGRCAATAGVAAGMGPKVLPTRGKTAPGRLRRLDAFICKALCEGRAPRVADGVLVDLGFGQTAVTTVDMARMLWRSWPRLAVVGVEADRARAEEAAEQWGRQSPADLRVLGPCLARRGSGTWGCPMEGLASFRHGGFLMPLAPEERPRVVAVRAMNVLRQYESLAECREAHRTVCGQLAEGGLLFEGTSDPRGDAIVAHVLRRADPFVPEAMFFALNLRAQARQGRLSLDAVAENLPPLLYRRDVPFFEDFFGRWRAAVAATDGGRGVRQHFLAAGKELARELPSHLGEVLPRKRWLRRGWLLWKRPGYPWGKLSGGQGSRG